MKKNVFRLLVWCIVLFGLSCFVVGCEKHDVAKRIEKTWAISLPEDIIHEYSKDRSSWFGDGERYNVFRLQTNPTNFIADFSYEKELSFESIVTSFAKRLNVIDNYLPSWEDNYCWDSMQSENTSDTVYIVYFFNTKMLIVCEQFN